MGRQVVFEWFHLGLGWGVPGVDLVANDAAELVRVGVADLAFPKQALCLLLPRRRGLDLGQRLRSSGLIDQGDGYRRLDLRVHCPLLIRLRQGLGVRDALLLVADDAPAVPRRKRC